MTRRGTWWIAIAVLLGTGAARLAAHPAADTEVVVTLDRSRGLEVTLATARDPLLLKLEALAGKAPDAALSEAAREGRILTLQSTLLGHLELTAEGKPVALAVIALDRVADRPGRIVIRFGGRLPPGATNLQWRAGLVYGSYVFAVQRDSGGASGPLEAFEWINGPARSQIYTVTAADTSARGVPFLQLVGLGVTHILPHGLDHILFVLGLFLLASHLRTLLLQVSAFTIAHSVTLGLALFGIVSVPAAVVEPLIALSIAYVAFENLLTSRLQPWRLLLVFGFGLLHGLGFADVLASLDLPATNLANTLIGFNLGVEIGQLAVILVAAVVVRGMRLPAADYRRWVARPASALIGLAGLFWMYQRLS